MAKPNMKAGTSTRAWHRTHARQVSEKARAIAGGVLEAVLMKYNR
jgi:hypothetical protein